MLDNDEIVLHDLLDIGVVKQVSVYCTRLETRFILHVKTITDNKQISKAEPTSLDSYRLPVPSQPLKDRGHKVAQANEINLPDLM